MSLVDNVVEVMLHGKNETRAGIWAIDFSQKGCAMTLAIGIGQGESKGKVMVKVPGGISQQQTVAILEGVIAGIKSGQVIINQ